MKRNEVPGIVHQAVPKAVCWACSAGQNVPWNVNKDAYSTVHDPVKLFVFSAVARAEYDVGVLATILAGGSQHSSPPHLGLELYLGGVGG